MVAYKLFYAEKSSKLMDVEDNYGALYKKMENLNEKCKVKDDIIKNLISDRDKLRENLLSGNNNVYSLTQRNSLISYDSSMNNNNNSIESEGNNNKKNLNLKKGQNIILDSNKSILSKNSGNNNNELNLTNSNEQYSNTNNTNINNKRDSQISYQTQVFSSENNFNSHNNIPNPKLFKNKSNGLFGSFKNLFGGDKKK